MADQELEMQEAEADEILESEDSQLEEIEEDDDLQEKKAEVKEFDSDDGVSKVDDSDAKKNDEKKKGKGDSADKISELASVGPKSTKTAMINAMLGAMKGMKKDDLAASWGKITASFEPEDDSDEDEDKDKVDEKKTPVKFVFISVKEIKKVTKEDIDVSADVKALFGDEDLSEEFKSSATTIFEAAVLSKINEVLETVCVDLDEEVSSEKEEILESLSSRLDDYLEYVVEEWSKDNELAIQQGARLEITENFMSGLRVLFTENYIDIPEEKVDLVDELAEKVQELEASFNSEIEKNISLTKDFSEMKKESILQVVSENLSDTQSEKLRSLADGIDFDNDEDYKRKLETVKENYFPAEESVGLDDEEPLYDEGIEKGVDDSMSAYMGAITRSIKK
mgnify:CR=1 FL=1